MSESTDILLVEDDPGDVHLALAVFRSLQMKWFAALSLLRHVRADAALRRIPVVIIAAAPDTQMIKAPTSTV
jgi:CheY-like chemotaxis protein